MRRRGIYLPPYDHSTVTRAILQGGCEWERRVIEDKIAGMMHRPEMHTAAGQALDFTVKRDMYLEGTRLTVYRR